MAEPSEQVPVESLLAQAAWVDGLARRLVFDADRADDVAQATWLVALGEPRRSLARWRGWIASVLRNQARQAGRADARRARRERSVARDVALPSTAELVCEADTQRELVACVLGLAEPYRSTLLLRYYRGHEPSEIAAMQGVSPGTVRSRVSRGLAQLRELLAERFGDEQQWRPALAALARRAGAAGGLAGGIWMGKLTAASVAVAGVALLAWWAGRGGPEEAGDATSAARSAAPNARLAAAGDGERAGALEAGATASGRTEMATSLSAAAAPATELFRGVVTARDGEPIPGARVRFHHKPGWHESEPFARGTTDGDGRFAVDASGWVEPTLIAVDADGFQGLSTDPVTPNREIGVRLRRTTTVFGVVREAGSAAAIAGARVRHHTEVVTDEGGRYRLSGVPVDQRVTLTVEHDEFATRFPEVLVPDPSEARFDVELARGTLLTPVVIDRESGVPVAGARVESRSFPDVVTGVDGAFAFRVAVDHPFEVTVRAEGYAALRWHHTPAGPPVESSPELPLARVAWIEGRVVDEAGDPLAASVYSTNEAYPFDVSVDDETRRAHGVEGRLDHDVDDIGDWKADEDGRFAVAVVPCEAPYGLHVSGGGRVDRDEGPFLLSAGDQRVWVDVTLVPGATVRGSVVFNGGADWSGDVLWRRADGRFGGRADVEAGRYELRGVAPGEITLLLRTLTRTSVPEPVTLTVEVGASYERDFVWDEPRDSITGRVVHAGGAPAVKRLVSATGAASEAGRADATWTDAEGGFTLEVPADDVYTLSVRGDGWGLVEEGFAAGASGVELVLPELAPLRVELVDAETGEPVFPSRRDRRGIGCRRPGEEAFRALEVEPALDGTFEVELPVGTVELELLLVESGWAPVRVSGVSVASGGSTHRVELTRGAELVLELPPGRPLDGSGSLFFALGEAQLDSVRGPFPRQGGPSNHRINGVNMWIESTGLIQQLFYFEDGRATVRGLPLGTVHLRAFPEDVVFTPATVELVGGRQTVAVDWTR